MIIHVSNATQDLLTARGGEGIFSRAQTQKQKQGSEPDADGKECRDVRESRDP